MINTNTNNINQLKSGFNTATPLNINWFQHTNVTNDFELSSQYAHICHQHKQEKEPDYCT